MGRPFIHTRAALRLPGFPSTRPDLSPLLLHVRSSLVSAPSLFPALGSCCEPPSLRAKHVSAMLHIGLSTTFSDPRSSACRADWHHMGLGMEADSMFDAPS